MKKRITVLFMAMLMVLSVLAGCSKKASATPEIVGTWTLTTIEAGGQSVKLEEYAAQLGGNADALKMTMEFKEDGTAALTSAGASLDGSWKVNGDNVDIEFNGETNKINFADGKVTLEDATAGIKMIFEK